MGIEPTVQIQSVFKIPIGNTCVSLIIKKFKYIRSSSDWPRTCCSSSCANIVAFNSSSWTSSKSSSIWPESGRKRRSPGLKKHMLIRSTIVRIRTRRDHFWTSSVLVELQKIRILVLKYEGMEWSAGPIGSRANIDAIKNKIKINLLIKFSWKI